jgi:hypothetical protein
MTLTLDASLTMYPEQPKREPGYGGCTAHDMSYLNDDSAF